MRPQSTDGVATIDDLYREPGKAELVNGRIVRMPPASGLHGYAAPGPLTMAFIEMPVDDLFP